MSFDIYLSSPHMSGQEMKYIQQAFDTNWVAPLGPNVEAFEKEVASYLGTGIHALALSSGTAAIHLALKLLAVTEGDRVICSSLTFIGSANPILYCGAVPVFVDSERESWNMSPAALEKALNDLDRRGIHPKAAVLANLYGQSSDMDALIQICDRFGVPVIEDAAESLGATYRGRKSGTFGRFSILSFNGNKIITTSGGGMLLSHDEADLGRARFLATQARDPARHYQHSEIGYNYRLSNLLAGVGRAQMQVLDERVAARRAVYAKYHSAFSGLPGVSLIPEASFGESTRWLTVMLLDPQQTSVTPTQIMDRLLKRKIESRPVWKPLHLQPLFAGCEYFPHASGDSFCERLFGIGVCLPSGSNLTDDQQSLVVSEIRALF